MQSELKEMHKLTESDPIKRSSDDAYTCKVVYCEVYSTSLIGVSIIETWFTPVYGTVH